MSSSRDATSWIAGNGLSHGGAGPARVARSEGVDVAGEERGDGGTVEDLGARAETGERGGGLVAGAPGHDRRVRAGSGRRDGDGAGHRLPGLGQVEQELRVPERG